MRVGIYAGTRNRAAAALAEGFSLIGVEVAHRNGAFYRGEIEDFDFIVSIGMRAAAPAVCAYTQHGIPAVVADWGYLKRVSEPGEAERGYYQVGIGGLNAVPPFDCPSDRFDALGLTVAPRGGDPKGYVLVCGQVPGDAAHGLDADSYLNWLREIVSQHPDAVYRPHPRGGIDLPGVESHTGSLDEALSGARLVVTWNSNVGHDALLAGVPVVAHGPAAYSELAGETLPSVDTRREYFHRVAYGQWTLDEMRSGVCQQFILDHLLTGVEPAVNPHTGAARDARDAASDPDGTLCIAPGDPLIAAKTDDGLDSMTVDDLRALAKERGVKVHPRTGAERLRAILMEAA